MKKIIFLLLLMLTVCAYAKEYMIIVPKEDISIEAGKFQSNLEKGVKTPFIVDQHDHRYFYAKPFNTSFLKLGTDRIKISKNSSDAVKINLKYYEKTENSLNLNEVFENYKKNKADMSELETYVFIEQILFWSIKKDIDLEIKKELYSYFEGSANKDYLKIMCGVREAYINMAIYQPILLNLVKDEESFSEILAKARTMSNEEYQIEEVDREYFWKAAELKRNNYEKKIFYSDFISAVSNYGIDQDRELFLKELKESKINILAEYYNILNSDKSSDKLKFLSDMKVEESLKRSMLIREKDKTVLLAAEKIFEENGLDTGIFYFLPYEDYNEKLVNSIKSITMDAKVQKSDYKLKPDEFYDSYFVKNNLINMDIIYLVESYDFMIYYSQIKYIADFSPYRDDMKNRFKKGAVTNRNFLDIIKNLKSIDPEGAQFYAMTLSTVLTVELDYIIERFGSDSEFADTILSYIQTFDLLRKESILVAGDKSKSARYSANVIKYLLLSTDNYSLIEEMVMDYQRENPAEKEILRMKLSEAEGILSKEESDENVTAKLKLLKEIL